MLASGKTGKRREVNWQPMATAAAMIFDTTITTRGFTGHEMVDSVGLVHMNGRVYDPELGRFLSADPHVQDATNLQSWNRYAYVLNNPLSYTDPTGFFFSKLFKSIGRAIGNFFKAVGRVLKKALQNPIIRGIIQIIGCAVTTVAGCAAISAGLALAAGGSVVDALTAAAFSFAQIHIWDQVGIFVSQTIGAISNVGAALAKGIVHGVVGGALSVAQGGSFLQGFAASGIAGFAGGFSNIISGGDIALDTAIVAAAGCAGAVLSGGKCANGAVTAAFANLYNKWNQHHTTPSEVIKWLRKNHPNALTGEITGVRGNANRRAIEEGAHRNAHNKPTNGGRYNPEFLKRLKAIANKTGTVTSKDVAQVRNQLMRANFRFKSFRKSSDAAKYGIRPTPKIRIHIFPLLSLPGIIFDAWDYADARRSCKPPRCL